MFNLSSCFLFLLIIVFFMMPYVNTHTYAYTNLEVEVKFIYTKIPYPANKNITVRNISNTRIIQAIVTSSNLTKIAFEDEVDRVERKYISENNLSVKIDYIATSLLQNSINWSWVGDDVFGVSVYSGNNSMLVFIVVGRDAPSNKSLINYLVNKTREFASKRPSIKNLNIAFIVLKIHGYSIKRFEQVETRVYKMFEGIVKKYCSECSVTTGTFSYGLMLGIIVENNVSGYKIYRIVTSKHFFEEVKPILELIINKTGAEIIYIIVFDHLFSHGNNLVEISPRKTANTATYEAPPAPRNTTSITTSGNETMGFKGLTNKTMGRDWLDYSTLTLVVAVLIVAVVASSLLLYRKT